MEYTLYRGKVEGLRLKEENNSYVIRILPLMEEIQETEMLPLFPSFFLDSLERYSIGDNVWVLSEESFQVGYVIGLCETPEGRNITSLVDKVIEIEKKLKLPISSAINLGFRLTGEAYLDFYDSETLINGRLNNTGSCIVFGPNGEFFLVANDSYYNLGDTTIKEASEEKIIDNNFTLTAAQVSETSEGRKVNVMSKNEEMIGGDSTENVLGNKVEVYQKKDETVLTKETVSIGLGKQETVVSGGVDIKVLAGNYSITTMLGKVIINSVGGMQLNLGPTGMNILSAGPVTVTSPQMNLNTTNLNIKALTITAPNGFTAPTGSGPFCALPICPFTGLPHLGNVFAGGV